MNSTSPSLHAQIKTLFNRLGASERLPKDEMEQEWDLVAGTFKALPRSGIVTGVWKAVGKSVRRRRHALFILSGLFDTPEVASHAAEWLNDPDPRSRCVINQAIEEYHLVQFAPLLNRIITSDTDTFCRDAAVHAAGTLRQPINLPVILFIGEERPPEYPHYLVWALKDYASEECRPLLQHYFEDTGTSKEDRVVAAWGLARMGEAAAFKYLVAMLEDPDLHVANGFLPGVSLRAAQAICEIKGWNYQWRTDAVEETRQLLRARATT